MSKRKTALKIESKIKPTDNPNILEGYRDTLIDSGDALYRKRLAIMTPTTGLIRAEWAAARYGQIIPCNWDAVHIQEMISGYWALRYQIADAQNILTGEVLANNYEWALFIEQDVVLPPDAFIRFNEYMSTREVPVVSGLYWTKSTPPEPILYRGKGNSFFREWKMGEKVWVDGVPTGCLLIHASLLREMWNDSEAYIVKGRTVHRVFETPAEVFNDPEKSITLTEQGTSDLFWCNRLIKGNYLKKAGWTEFSRKKYPLLVDTNIACRHISPDGRMYP